jgi:hypothetical protein
MAVIYSAGFRGTTHRVRDNGAVVLCYVNEAVHSASVNKIHEWWFNQSDDRAYPAYFWGDLDFSGIAILAALKKQFPTINSWKPAYEKMAEALESGNGHFPSQAQKENQLDPGVAHCEYADEVLLPLMRDTGKFLDQEWVDLNDLLQDIE